MWGKTFERPDLPLGTAHLEERSPERTSQMVACVGKTMQFRGDIYSDEELYIDGEIEGTLEVNDRLTIGPNGKVKATVKAKELVVRGSIHGNVEATGRIVIMNGASIIGDVKTAGIVIEDGAFFKGGIDILRSDVQQPDASTSTPAVKSQSAGA
jgi:cytoskeletal protein CcmA (bactofilin family)